MAKIVIDNYTRRKVQSLSVSIFARYKQHMFLEVFEKPEEQRWWDEYLNKRLRVSQEEYDKALVIAKQNPWFNNLLQVQIPEAELFVNRTLDGTIKRLRQIKKLK